MTRKEEMPRFLVKWGDSANEFEKGFDSYEDANSFFNDKMSEVFEGYERKYRFETLRINQAYVALWSEVNWTCDQDGEIIENGCADYYSYDVEEYRELMHSQEEEEGRY